MPELDQLNTPTDVLPDGVAKLWARIRSVDDFALCDRAELIRVFPRLLPRNGTVPLAVRGHLTRCLAVLAWRSAARGDGAVLQLLRDGTGLDVADMLALGVREHGSWFRGGGKGAARAVNSSPSAAPVDEVACFALLETLRLEISDDALRDFDPEAAALFAFSAGLHPAYLWAEALLSHEYFTAIGWLGQLWRCGQADVPRDVAEYFDDAIDASADGKLRLRDQSIARFLPPDTLVEVYRGVLARREGLCATVCWSHGADVAARQCVDGWSGTA